jgi:hypothetical protein
MQFSLASLYSSLFGPNIFPSALFSNILILCVPLNAGNPLKTQKQIPKKGLVSRHIPLNVSE